MCALPVFIAMSSFERMAKNQTMMCWTSGDIFRPFAMNPIPCNHKTSEYSAIKLGLLQIKTLVILVLIRQYLCILAKNSASYARFLFAILFRNLAAGHLI